MARRKPVSDLSRAMWQFLLYPDSAVSGPCKDMAAVWRYLDDYGAPIIVSPLHDRDVYEEDDLERGVKAGELKKPHYHCMVLYDGPVPYRQCLESLEDLGVKKLKLVRSRRTFEQYTIHKNSPFKAQYDAADIRTFGGYEVKFLGDEYELDSISQLHELIEQLGITQYADLSLQLSRNYPELIPTLLRNYGHFNSICRSRESIKKQSAITGLMSSYKNTRFMIGE